VKGRETSTPSVALERANLNVWLVVCAEIVEAQSLIGAYISSFVELDILVLMNRQK
jgi:hypothetical protein